jgi:site-specific DNA-methyltransferase (adenine-specific)
VIPARWYAGGKGLNDFRDRMRTGKVVKQIVDFPVSADIFSNVYISGGVQTCACGSGANHRFVRLTVAC